GQSVQMDIVEVRWVREMTQFGSYRWENQEIPAATDTVTTGEDGQASYHWRPLNTGIFRVWATVTDAQGRSSRSELWVYVRDSIPQASRQLWGEPYVYRGRCGNSSEYQQLRLIADKDSYVPGDVAEILIPNPYDESATALITVERARIMQQEVREITGDSLLYQLPLTDDHAPTVYVNVLLMRGASAANPNPATVRGDIALVVEPVNRRLTVALESSTLAARPGEDVRFNVRLTDSQGQPVVGEVGLALTDEAVLALLSPNSGTLEAAFYSRQPLQVQTTVGMRALLTVPANTSEGGCGGGGGEGPAEPVIRDDFEYTPLWAPHVVTDANGQATVSLEMPDNLTRWRLDARAVTADAQVGQGQINFISTMPLLIRAVTPRFLVAGDQFPLAAIINNNTDQLQIVTARIAAAGVSLESDAEVTGLRIPAHSRVRVEWPVTVQDVAGADITVFVTSESGLQDASKPPLTTGPDGTIPVIRYTAPDMVATGGVLLDAGTRLEGISLPPRFAGVEGTLTMQFDPSIAATTLDSLNYLRNFPHQCVEQTVSRFYPNAVTYNALRSLAIDDPELTANLQTALDEAYTLLKAGQNRDGGWGWFTGMDSSPYVTAYTLLGLYEAQKAGYTLDAEMLRDALAFTRQQIIAPDLQTPGWALNRQAFLVYVLGLYGEADQTQMDRLYTYRLKMSLAARAHLLMAYQNIAPEAEALTALTSDLTSAVVLSANGAHWEESERDWMNWGSNTRTTAIVLLALERSQSDHPLLPQVVRWLMTARRGTHWQTTQETAWAVVALSEWMVNTGELQGDYRFTVQLNDAELLSRAVVPETVRTGETLQVAVSDLSPDAINRLTVDRDAGPGALYYSALLNLQLPADAVPAVSRGVQIDREYFVCANRQPVSSAQVGDTITVRLTVNVPQDVYYFALEDAIPAGLEVLDRSLLTTAQASYDPQRECLFADDPYWYWRAWYFDRTELRDKGAVLYADFLPKGTYIYTYRVRAVTPGRFQTLPAVGYTFYDPDVFGRTNGMLFEVYP
ncbi:MAG: hypothetical protein K8I60_12990, partial [Anaerolineae bacterium]|nr:hypothetical protein [Anaerolineae bacterium]